MVAFAPSDLPGSLNTVEELAVWALSILSENYPLNTVVESPGRPARQVTCSPYYMSSADPVGWYVIGRFCLKVNDSWRQSGQLFTQVNEIGTLPIPSGYKIAA